MRRGGLTLRAMALLAPGTLAVHELRYLAAYGGDAQPSLDHQGHAYLAALTPLVVCRCCWLRRWRICWSVSPPGGAVGHAPRGAGSGPRQAARSSPSIAVRS